MGEKRKDGRKADLRPAVPDRREQRTVDSDPAHLFQSWISCVAAGVFAAVVYVSHAGSRELFRLAVLAIALGVAFGAANLRRLVCLGAFFAGMILSESELSLARP